MEISGVRLNRVDGDLVVGVETVNGWIEVIRERDDGTTPISHICESSGLRQANREAGWNVSMADLRASGGIPDMP